MLSSKQKGIHFSFEFWLSTQAAIFTFRKIAETKIKRMIEPTFVDEMDCGSFFDDLLDFPADEAATADAYLPVDAAENFKSPATTFLPAAKTDALPASDSAFARDPAATDLSAELSVPYEDIVQLEWLSNFVEDSFSGGSLTMKKVEPSCITITTNEDLTHTQFQISSPVSVLESSNTCSGDKNAPCSPEICIPVPCVRARSKRHRPATFNPHPVMQLISPASSVGENMQPNVNSKASSDSEDFSESHPVIKLPRQGSGEHKKKKKTKVPNPLAKDETNQNASVQAVRKCMHCEITKTPQWRAGPMGPKTLCNACGVRYKSGRLFPEYRPAASPTFCPAVHSNSHKKVLEMRNKMGQEPVFATDSAAFPELIPNTNGGLALEYM